MTVKEKNAKYSIVTADEGKSLVMPNDQNLYSQIVIKTVKVGTVKEV